MYPIQEQKSRGDCKKAGKKDHLSDQEIVQRQNMAARQTQEIEMKEIMDELQNLYGKTTKSQTAAGSSKNYRKGDTKKILASIPDGLNRNVMKDKPTP